MPEDVVIALNDWKILGPLAQLANDTREQDVDQWLWNVIQTVTAESARWPTSDLILAHRRIGRAYAQNTSEHG